MTHVVMYSCFFTKLTTLYKKHYRIDSKVIDNVT